MTGAIRNALALGAGVLILGGGSYLAGRCSGSDDATREAAERVVKEQAGLVAEMVDSLVGARLALLHVDTVVRTILTSRPPPPRPVVPPTVVLDTVGRDTLISIIRAQETHIDTLSSRLTLVTAALDTAYRSFTRYRTFADSAIASQGRQIVAMQVVIDNPPKRSPIGIGGCAGYVVSATSRGGPGVCIGATFSLSLSSLWPFGR